MNGILVADDPDLPRYEQLCHQYILNNPESSANQHILYDYLVLLLRAGLFERFERAVRDAGDLGVQDGSFEFLQLVSLYLQDRYDEFGLRAAQGGCGYNAGALSRMQAVAQFNSGKYDSPALEQHRDLQVLKNLKLFNYADALRQLDALLYEMEQSHSLSESVLNIAGIVFLFQNKFKQSAKVYRQALRAGGPGLSVLNNYANLLCRQGDLVKGVLLYRRVHQLANDRVVRRAAARELVRWYKELERQCGGDAELRRYYQGEWRRLAKE